MQSVHLILLSNGKWDSVHPKDTILTETVTPLKSTPLFIQPNNMLNDWWEKWESLPTFLRFCNICCILFIFHMITEPIARVDIYVTTKAKSSHYSLPNWDMLLEFDKSYQWKQTDLY